MTSPVSGTAKPHSPNWRRWRKSISCASHRRYPIRGNDSQPRRELVLFLRRTDRAQRRHHVGKTRRRAVDEGQGPAYLDRRNTDPRREHAVDNTFAKPSRQLRRDAVADDLLDDGVAGRDAAG